VEYKIYQAPKGGIQDLSSDKRGNTRFIKHQKGEYKFVCEAGSPPYCEALALFFVVLLSLLQLSTK